MTLLAETSSHAEASYRTHDAAAGIAFSFAYRRFEAAQDRSNHLGFRVTLLSGGGGSIAAANATATTKLQAAAAFLVDAAHDVVPAATLVRMIGLYVFASGEAAGAGAVTVSLASTRGDAASAQVLRPEFEIEGTAFGAAHVLHEDDTLGLYILEIAPHSAIPAHCHRVMRERELILDDGLLLQGRPVARGNAFDWPLGHVHAYRNPTGNPLRILCIDSPRFMPEDEVTLVAPRLAPLAPLGNYLA